MAAIAFVCRYFCEGEEKDIRCFTCQVKKKQKRQVMTCKHEPEPHNTGTWSVGCWISDEALAMKRGST